MVLALLALSAEIFNDVVSFRQPGAHLHKAHR
jgi:hypothetical protein